MILLGTWDSFEEDPTVGDRSGGDVQCALTSIGVRACQTADLEVAPYDSTGPELETACFGYVSS